MSVESESFISSVDPSYYIPTNFSFSSTSMSQNTSNNPIGDHFANKFGSQNEDDPKDNMSFLDDDNNAPDATKHTENDKEQKMDLSDSEDSSMVASELKGKVAKLESDLQKKPNHA